MTRVTPMDALSRDELEDICNEALAACWLVIAQFDGIADDKWATMGMRIAVDKCREVVERCDTLDD